MSSLLCPPRAPPRHTQYVHLGVIEAAAMWNYEPHPPFQCKPEVEQSAYQQGKDVALHPSS